MLVNLEPVKFKQIIPPQLLEWDEPTWLEVKKILPSHKEYIFEEKGYQFAPWVNHKGEPSIKVVNPAGDIKYLHFISLQESLVSEILTLLVYHKVLMPSVLLDGLKVSFEGFLRVHSDLCSFQIQANNLAKEYICEPKN